MNLFSKLYHVITYIPFYSIPDQIENNFINIDFILLKKQGVKCIVVDIDQTLVPQSSNQMSKEILDKIDKIKTIFGDNSICFLTNEPSKIRHRILFEQANVETIDTHGIHKPSPKAFNYALQYFDISIKPNEVCFIGDRIWTDIIGANNVGFHTIKIDPYDEKSDRYVTKILRITENYITYLFILIHGILKK